MPEAESESLDLLWGARDIAAFIGRSRRQAYQLLEKGELPARRVNSRWVASRKTLTAFFELQEVDG